MEKVRLTKSKIILPVLILLVGVFLVTAQAVVTNGEIIVDKDVLDLMNNKAINFHLSYLPWNKGIDPIFWSQFDNTITGVSIHYMDEGFDTGPIIARKKIDLPEDATLRSAYKILRYEAEKLLYEFWHKIISGNAPGIKQEEEGSYNSKEDTEKWKFLLTEGIDTPLRKIRDYGIKKRENRKK